MEGGVLFKYHGHENNVMILNNVTLNPMDPLLQRFQLPTLFVKSNY